MVTPPEISFAQLLFGSIGFMLLAGVTLLGFLITYQRRLLQQQLRLQQVETRHQQQLLTAAIEAQEEERERIGQDLHDGLGSALAMAKLLVGRLGTPPAAGSSPAVLALLEELTGTMVRDVRSISHNLYPAILARFGLAEALQHLVDTCNEVGKLPVALELRYLQSLDLAQELALYRICQELLANSLQHAQGATHVHVQLQQAGALLTLTVADDGVGFAPALAGSSPRRGVGLRSVAARVQLLGGRLIYPRETGPGTCTVIEIPLPHLLAY